MHPGVQPFIWAGLEMEASHPVRRVESIPQYMRDVPMHHDDDYPAANRGPIEDDDLRVPPLIKLKILKAGLEGKLAEEGILGKLGYQLDVNLSLSATYLPEGTYFYGGEVSRRNYSNAVGTNSRGSGAALTIVDAGYAPAFIPGLNGELRYDLSDRTAVLLGSGISQAELQVIQGYDRYDRLTRREGHDVARITETTVYLGLEGSYGEGPSFLWSLKFGVGLSDIDRLEAVQLKRGCPLFGGASFGWQW